MGKYKKPSLALVLAVFICVSIAAAGIVSAVTMDSYYDVNLAVVNDNGARFDIYGNEEYNFFNETQIPNGGLNALHITSSTNSPYGQVTNTSSQSGIFYMSNTGGGGWFDNGILMIAVNGTLPENFSVDITSSGYTWTPVASGSYPYFNNANYNSAAISETFTADEFDTTSNAYGMQIWRPSTNYPYPIYDGQDMDDEDNTFSIIFVDLYAGIIGTNIPSQYGWSGATDNGMLKVTYDIDNLPSGSMVAFDGYAFCQNSPKGTGVRWTNALNPLGNLTTTVPSGYYVQNW